MFLLLPGSKETSFFFCGCFCRQQKNVPNCISIDLGTRGVKPPRLWQGISRPAQHPWLWIAGITLLTIAVRVISPATGIAATSGMLAKRLDSASD